MPWPMSKQHPAAPRLPDAVCHAAVAHDAFGQRVEAVGDHVAGSEQRELLVERPVGSHPRAEQQRAAGTFGGLQRAVEHGVRVHADRGAGVDGDPPDQRAAVFDGGDARVHVGVGERAVRAVGIGFARAATGGWPVAPACGWRRSPDRGSRASCRRPRRPATAPWSRPAATDARPGRCRSATRRGPDGRAGPPGRGAAARPGSPAAPAPVRSRPAPPRRCGRRARRPLPGRPARWRRTAGGRR